MLRNDATITEAEPRWLLHHSWDSTTCRHPPHSQYQRLNIIREPSHLYGIARTRYQESGGGRILGFTTNNTTDTTPPFPTIPTMWRSCTYHYMSLLVAWQRCHCHLQHQAQNLLAQWHPAHYSITSSIWDNRKPGQHCSIRHGRGTKRASPVDEELLLSTNLSPSKRTWGGDVTDVAMREKAPAVIQKE